MAKETTTARESAVNPINAVSSGRSKTYQQATSQYLRIQNRVKDIVGQDVMFGKPTKSKQKLQALSRLDRANNAFNRIIREERRRNQ